MEGVGADFWKPNEPVPCELKATRGLCPSQNSAENDSDRLQEEKFTDVSPILGPKHVTNFHLEPLKFLDLYLNSQTHIDMFLSYRFQDSARAADLILCAL